MAKRRTGLGLGPMVLGLAALASGVTGHDGLAFPLLLGAFVLAVVGIPGRLRAGSRAQFEALGTTPDAAERMGSLAVELMMPGGRSNDEVMREAAALYEQLPPELRAELDERGHAGPGVRVEAHGPLGRAVASMAGFPAPEPEPGETRRPSAWTVAPDGTTTVDEPPAPTAPTVAADLGPQPEQQPVPVVVPPGTPPVEPETRFGVLAPDVLTGDEDTAPGAIAEGWYKTADGTRERWHNGAAWTAHERTPGGY